MGEAFKMGGWGMYPTALFGLLALAAAGYYALRPAPERAALVRITAWMTFVAGCLGFATGLIRSCTSMGGLPAEKHFYVFIGFGESLVNVAWALILIQLALLLASVGYLRAARRSAA